MFYKLLKNTVCQCISDKFKITACKSIYQFINKNDVYDDAAYLQKLQNTKWLEIIKIYNKNPAYITKLEFISSTTRKTILEFIDSCGKILLNYIFINDKQHTIQNFRYLCDCDNTFKPLLLYNENTTIL